MANREDDLKPNNPNRTGTGGVSDPSRERSSTQPDPLHGHGTGQADKLGNPGGSKGSGGSSQHR